MTANCLPTHCIQSQRRLLMNKRSQKAVRYRLGAPMTQCSCCQMYRKNEQSPLGSCTEVTGKISAYGVCDRFSALNNPWGNKLTTQSRTILARCYAQARG